MDPATRALIEKMQQRIDGLEKRLADLEKGQGQHVAAVAPAPAPVAPAAPAAVHDHDQAPIPADLTHPEYPNLKIAGFGDIDFVEARVEGVGASEVSAYDLHVGR